jgi:hypothetical protein
MEQDYNTVAQQSWNRSASRPFAHKTKYLAADLRKWRKNNPKLSDQLAAVEDELLQQQSKPPTSKTSTSRTTSPTNITSYSPKMRNSTYSAPKRTGLL